MKKYYLLLLPVLCFIYVGHVSDIRAESNRARGMVYIVGAGCGDPDLLTLRAISYIKKADYIVCVGGLEKNLSQYIAGRPVLFDPLLQVPHFYKKKYPHKTMNECMREAEALYVRNIATLKDHLSKGNSIALIEPGDPTLFGGWSNWLYPHIGKDRIKIIAGISAFNEANTFFKNGEVSEGSVIITEPKSILRNESTIKSAAENNDTIVIFMALNRIDKISPVLRKYFNGSTPVFVIYNAGSSKDEYRVKTDLDRLQETVRNNRETFRGLIYIGKNLPD
ncbi:MAG TPA: SAM-dependent methyltransferase [Spirochaetota bacterium]|nr:SAM-dependent methyltransferase [Spirochaetota bacterium]HQP48991.1 SAM-dependent methyltransferase [Spirochaetota bacterium]